MKLWKGRFSKPTNTDFALLNNSLPVDQRMALEDVDGSIAWAGALLETGLLTAAEKQSIVEGLRAIKTEFKNSSFLFKDTDEDIHTAVERRLTEMIGETGGKLHTGRSRNDQVATDLRLWVIRAIPTILEAIQDVQGALLNRAETDFDIILPGYTHLQQAQPVLMSHWWLSHFWALDRDFWKFQQLLEETGVSPLGSAALAGSTEKVDRHRLAAILGFHSAASNSMDAVADRDFVAGFLFCASLTAVHLSKMAEMIILFNSQEFGFVTLPDEYSTGSSLMPHKKNPDLFEITRGKTGTMIGHLAGMLATLKGLPSAYDKDLQEDKQHVFSVYDSFLMILITVGGALENLIIHPQNISRKLDWRMLATDIADYLVEKGIPFRKAHEYVGNAVSMADALEVPLPNLPLEEWQQIHPAFQADLYSLFDFRKSLEKHDVFGGTAPQRVKDQMMLASERLGR